MINKIIMPKLGETMEFGALIKWHKKEGDTVEKGEILFEVETDKAVFENEAVRSGYLRKIVIPASDDNIKVLKVVGYLADSMDEPIPAEEQVSKPPPNLPLKKGDGMKEKEPKVKEVSKAERKRIFISPLARKMAKESGIDISIIIGTGPKGRIVARDIKAALPAKEVPFKETKRIKEFPKDIKAPVTRIKELSRVNKIAAERVTLSKTTIPHFYLSQKINMTEAVKLRSQLKDKVQEKYSVKLTITDVIIKALSLSLQKFGDLNGTYENEVLKLTNSINIGLAVAAEDDLYVPVIKNSQNLSISQIAIERTNLIDSVRSRKIDLDKLTGGTFTLTNLGNTGIENFAAIINPPQLGIIATGSILKEPVVSGEEIVISDIMRATLSCDHRVVNGVYGAQFLLYFKELLESPYTLLSGGY